MSTIDLETIEDNIEEEYFFNVGRVLGVEDEEDNPLNTLTICVLVMTNGYTVVGHSNCIDPERFEQPIGCSVARDNAVDQCWPLLGFLLKDRLAEK